MDPPITLEIQPCYFHQTSVIELRQAFGVRWPDTALLVFCFGIRLLAMGDASIFLANRGDAGQGHCHFDCLYMVRLASSRRCSNDPRALVSLSERLCIVVR